MAENQDAAMGRLEPNRPIWTQKYGPCVASISAVYHMDGKYLGRLSADLSRLRKLANIHRRDTTT